MENGIFCGFLQGQILLGGGQCRNMGSRGEVPGSIFESVPPDILCKNDNITSTGVAIFPENYPQGWGPFHFSRVINLGQLPPIADLVKQG